MNMFFAKMSINIHVCAYMHTKRVRKREREGGKQGCGREREREGDREIRKEREEGREREKDKVVYNSRDLQDIMMKMPL